MEPINKNDLFKNAVENEERDAYLSSAEKDMLWMKIKEEKKSGSLLYWKVACAILFLISAVFGYSFYSLSKQNAELATAFDLKQKQVEKDKASKKSMAAKVEEPEQVIKVVKDTIVQSTVEYVYRTKVIYKEGEGGMSEDRITDSLVHQIALREAKIRELQLPKIQTTVDSDEVKSSGNPILVAFQQKEEEAAPKEQKEGKIKFQLSLLNIK